MSLFLFPDFLIQYRYHYKEVLCMSEGPKLGGSHMERMETFERGGESIEKKKKRGGVESGSGVIDKREPAASFAKAAPNLTFSKKYCPKILFIFRGVYSPEAQQSFIDAQYADTTEVCEYLGVTREVVPKDLKLFVLVFDTQEKKKVADPFHVGSRASARFNEMELYRVWMQDEDPHFPHELTHLIAHTWGEPYSWVVELKDSETGKEYQRATMMVSTSFFQEGLAIAVDELQFRRSWRDGKFADELCREYEREIREIESLEQCINFSDMNMFPDEVIMPFAGSFVKFLIQTFGMEVFRGLYVSVRETDSPWENVSEIERICGISEKELLLQWRESFF